MIVVDDGSTDQSAAIAESFGARLKVLHQSKQGAGAARNTGARAAEGEFLAFLDADDLWAPGKLERQLKAFGELSDLRIAFAYVENFISPDLTVQQRAQVVCPAEAMPGMSPSALIVRAESFYPFPEGLAVGELIPWLGRARDLNFKIHVIPEVLVSRRLHETNLGRTVGAGRKDYAAAIKQMLDRRRGS